MRKAISFSLLFGLLAACGDGNPFFETTDEGTSGADPTIGTSSVYGTALNGDLTMNSLDYDDQGTVDPSDDLLLVNNLPFDNADASGGGYTRAGTIGAFDLYESPSSGGAADREYFAVFKRTSVSQVAAVATNDYVGFGFGGATAQQIGGAGTPAARSDYYTFTGDYAAIAVVRPTAGGGSIGYITGDATLFVDILDFDDGSVEGLIENRQFFDATGAPLGSLAGYISLATATIDFDNDLTVASTAESLGGGTGTGQWSSVFAGPNGEEIAGIVVIEGTMPGGDPMRETGVFVATQTP